MTPFGMRLEKLRRSRNLKQIELAEKVGIKSSYVSVLESGQKGAPSAWIVKSIIKQLDLDDEESAALLRDAEVSDFTFRVPKGTSAYEFELLHELKGKLGVLSDKQISIIKMILSI
ncbi:helix-turn-helix domain-containing protein [Pseudoalteromonas piscicida]|uniref:helix-turn-helix domain-containing protein n=1 Tax=Pseudoalteromonas piscicida TaxID=43662 RepID=UPI0027E3D37C|nr:helix-turn-helix transcriptional regulator [Pseudoalteromonas piscicida]WMO15287.1 helix-turn-helix domain-containing protein [Pseudoalteromonas piscicida]